MHPSDGFPSARALRIGAATVAGVIVLVAGLLIGRATAGGASAPSTSSSTSTGPAAGVPVWATGATRMDHGTPVGYAHTREGAAEAARNYLLALNASPLALDPSAYRAARSFLEVPSAAESEAPSIERTLAGVSDLITAAHQGHVTRTVPFVLTEKVDEYGGDTARIAVWGGAVFGADGVEAPEMGLVEVTYSLRWLGDWRIADEGDSDGPGVKAVTTSAQTNSLPTELGSDYEGVGYATP